MRYKLLGNSGLRVSELALGTMTFGQENEDGVADKSTSRKLFHAFIEAGGNFIDTANDYTGGTSETHLGEFIASTGERDRFIVATKYTANMRSDDPNGGGNSRKSMVQSVEASLKRLQTDYIDLLWVHMWDSVTPIEEVMRGLDALIRSGKVLYIGVSDHPAWVVSQANTLAELKNWTPFIALQIEYSLIQRTPERELLPMAQGFGLTITPWSVLGAGLLTRKFNKKNFEPREREAEFERLAERRNEKKYGPRELGIADAVAELAEVSGRSSAQVALNWVRQKGTIPIIGTSKISQIEDSLAALGWTLTEKEMQLLDEVSNIELGFPHDFFQSRNVKKAFWGSTFDQVDRVRPIAHVDPTRMAR
ncbi:MAG TPA: aldo/keto reductase [Chthoniobacterales bacterium]|jgi:aryl-alcohol dehydrogenase-like predicted oxidoreductase|nr:aldo/keto reductase [Chthoniobacterales bacterium]